MKCAKGPVKKEQLKGHPKLHTSMRNLNFILLLIRDLYQWTLILREKVEYRQGKLTFQTLEVVPRVHFLQWVSNQHSPLSCCPIQSHCLKNKSRKQKILQNFLTLILSLASILRPGQLEWLQQKKYQNNFISLTQIVEMPCQLKLIEKTYQLKKYSKLSYSSQRKVVKIQFSRISQQFWNCSRNHYLYSSDIFSLRPSRRN